MNNSLQKLEWENTARLLFFKHRGNLSMVLKDLRAKYENEVDNVGERITISFVEKVIKKFKKEQKINDPFVAAWILEYVFMGTKQREVTWEVDDQDLEEHKFSYRSACCDAAAELHVNEGGEPSFICLKCEKISNAYRIPNLDIFEMKRKLRVEKRKDEEQLVKAVEGLGFGGEKAPVIKETNYQVLLGSEQGNRRQTKQVKCLVKEDRQMVEDIKQLKPMDREVVIRRLRQKLDTFPDEKE